MSEDLLLQLQRAIPILVYGIIAAGLIVLSLRHRKENQDELQSIARDLGGTVAGTMLTGRSVRVHTLGPEQGITIATEGGDDPTPCMEFHQRSDLDFSLTIVRETVPGRLLRKAGLPVDLQVGDPAFDGKYRIKSDSREKAARFLGSAERKRIVDLLFGEGFDRITIRKREVSLHLAGYSEHDLDPARLIARLDALKRFAAR